MVRLDLYLEKTSFRSKIKAFEDIFLSNNNIQLNEKVYFDHSEYLLLNCTNMFNV